MNIDLAALPDDIETLQRMVRSLAAERTIRRHRDADADAMLIEGIDWRTPERTWKPSLAR